MIFTRDFVTRENHCRIASLVTKKSLFTVTHAEYSLYLVAEQESVIHLHILESNLVITVSADALAATKLGMFTF